jgi:hypothetical protein
MLLDCYTPHVEGFFQPQRETVNDFYDPIYACRADGVPRQRRE